MPTDAGVLASCPQPTHFFPSAWVQCGRLRGPRGYHIFERIEIHKPLPHAVDDVMAFLTKHAYKSGVLGVARRKDVSSMRLEVIREVVVNALVHASYAERGIPIRAGLYNNRIATHVAKRVGMLVGMMWAC